MERKTFVMYGRKCEADRVMKKIIMFIKIFTVDKFVHIY